ncbi:Uncharacterized protein TCM_037931 [Theobroma cacao]|uniref:Uncharacterized protein n=1 Tax=Theobroma cacao TaxID=3641 RepID=A0A061GUR8_THECC|nr:Uncharacterized protein TCM_037931 [Theobroma cacao]
MSTTSYFLSTSNPCCRSQKPRKPSFRKRCLLMAKQQKTRNSHRVGYGIGSWIQGAIICMPKNKGAKCK